MRATLHHLFFACHCGIIVQLQALPFQAETWMTKQEAFLSNDDLGDSLDSVESLIKKHEDFEKSLAAQEEKINALDEFATKLIQGQHYAADDVARRRASLLDRRKQLMKKVKLTSMKIQDVQSFLHFPFIANSSLSIRIILD